jgi:hypothetical protein
MLERAESEPLTVRNAELACWEALVSSGAALLTGVLGLSCRTASETVVRERGWTLDSNEDLPRAKFRTDYVARLKSTFGPVAIPLFARNVST